MRIILVQDEIETAIATYVNSQGIGLEGKTLDIDLTAGRGSAGFTATIDINNGDSVVPGAAIPPPAEETEEGEENDTPIDENQALFD